MATPVPSDQEFMGTADFQSAVLANGDPGAAGEKWTSQGPGLPPVWAAPLEDGINSVIAGMIF